VFSAIDSLYSSETSITVGASVVSVSGFSSISSGVGQNNAGAAGNSSYLSTITETPSSKYSSGISLSKYALNLNSPSLLSDQRLSSELATGANARKISNSAGIQNGYLNATS